MGIYSANRVSGTGASFGTIRPDTSYAGTHGIGRCMYESAVNDVLFDESMLMQDYNEVRKVREGAIMESELQAVQEASIKGFFKTAKEMLVKLGKKIAGIFHSVYAKITQYIVRDGKAYAKMHRKEVMTKDISKLTIKKYRKPTGKDTTKFVSLIKLAASSVSGKYVESDKTPEEYGKDTLKEYLSGKETSEYVKYIVDECFEKEADIKGSAISGRLNSIFDNIENGKEAIKNLAKTEKEIKKKLAQATSDLKKAESEFENKALVKNVPYVRAEISALQTAITYITKGAIKVVNTGLKQDRSVIAQIVAYNPNSSKNESGILMYEVAQDAADEVDEILDSPEEVEVAEGMPEFDEIEFSPEFGIKISSEDDY